MWGLVGGSALVLGAAIGYWSRISPRAIAAVMAFGSGVLISALSFELIEDAYARSGTLATSVGFMAGAAAYTLATKALNARGAAHRKRSGDQQVSEREVAGSGLAIAFGALLDGVPESIVIGLSLIDGGAVSVVATCAVFLSNVPEGMSSAAGMRKAGRSVRYVFGVWGGIALLSGASALLGNLVWGGFPPSVVSATIAVAAGAILAMLVDTMIPEAFDQAHEYAGLITVTGFLSSFLLSKWR
jgi:ZIP family zinc transporter